MRLERVRIQTYKCLRDVTVDFRAPAGDREDFSSQLLVGVNGSGKSCFLEALGLIFTHIMQGEAPGFPFDLQYWIRRNEVKIGVRSEGDRPGKKGALKVTVSRGGKTEPMNRIPEEYLPRRIIACSSGANHMMESALLSSPRASLAGELYDLTRPELGQDVDEGAMNQLLRQYQTMDTSSRVFNIDGGTSRLILPVLFAVVPNFKNPQEAREYISLRDELTRPVSGRLTPIAFSITVDEDALEQIVKSRQNSPQYNLLAKLFRPARPDGGRAIHDWIVRRNIQPPAENPEEHRREADSEKSSGTNMSQTAVFCYETWPEKKTRWWSRRLSEAFDGDPLMLLNVLTVAFRSGVLRDIQFAFRLGGRRALLGLEALSDGELTWLARMGLVLMSRHSRSAETLFLFDEPDVYFNSEWNVNFINMLRRFTHMELSGLYHEFVIATHSTLLLTDAYAEQINLFSASEQGTVRAQGSPISPFAAQQDELSRCLFSSSAVGQYALDRVGQSLHEAKSPEDLEPLIRQTGPGYQRFRLYERYFDLKKNREQ